MGQEFREGGTPFIIIGDQNIEGGPVVIVDVLEALCLRDRADAQPQEGIDIEDQAPADIPANYLEHPQDGPLERELRGREQHEQGRLDEENEEHLGERPVKQQDTDDRNEVRAELRPSGLAVPLFRWRRVALPPPEKLAETL